MKRAIKALAINFNMKKILGILVLGLLLSGNAHTSSDLMVPGINSPGLKNLKEFNLEIDSTVYPGSEKMCNISYVEIETFVKKIIYSNSKIKFPTSFGHEQFLLTTNILEKSDICSAEISLVTYSIERGRNTASIYFTGPHVSFFDRGQIRIDNYKNFKVTYFAALEMYLLKFLKNWKKYN